jgi:ankyrin repeat protein
MRRLIYGKAIRANDKRLVREILSNAELRQNVSFRASFYLPLAARFGSADLVELLIGKCNYQKEKRAINEALVTSIDNDHFAGVVPLLIAYGADANHEFSEMTALGRIGYLYADDKSKSAKALKTARLLLEKGAYVDHFDQSGKTLLMSASAADNLDMVKLCLEYAANPNCRNKEAQSAISLAKPGSEVAKALNKKKNNKGLLEIELPGNKYYPPGEQQGMNISPKRAVKESLQMVAAKDPFRADPRQEIMQLSEAVSFGDVARVKELLARGVDANSTVDGSGITLLMQATNANIAKLLLNAGANAQAADANGWTALHYAATREADIIMITLLLRAGANVASRTAEGETPLRLAGLLFTEKISPTWGSTLIPLLVNAGADINSADNQGHTLLHQAAFNDNAKLGSLCVLMGADTDLRSLAGKTPRQLGRELGSQNFLKAISGK